VIDYFRPLESKEFNSIKISIASPEQIRSWSYGSVQRPDTINYRTAKPEHGGLFCSRIFGPIKDYECSCGKYKRMKYRGTVCEKCGVEVTTSKVRRERMGHIDLAAPVVHIWFLKSPPSRICKILDVKLKGKYSIESVLAFDKYLVKDPGITDFRYHQVISEYEYNEAVDKFGPDSFVAGMGAEIIQQILRDIDLKVEQKLLRNQLSQPLLPSNRNKIVKRLKVVEDFLESDNKLEWMVMDVLPVIPPDLRPLVMLDGGRFATYDLNELYRRVLNRNNRLQRLKDLRAPDIIIRNEKRMLQGAVDTLFDNSRQSKIVKSSSNKRPLKSLTDMLKGKHGRFRQNLLGKRVDYSGRSVIVVGPELKLHQCGIPKKMALELMKPFIYCKLQLYGESPTLKIAKQIVDDERPEVWDFLEEVIKDHPVILNRAPTLHRLGIQAFEPILIEGKAIKLHPLVCTAFNADFDGDQMALHLPISLEAQLEARVLMMSTNNILSSANGSTVLCPTQDIVLGIYYLSLIFNDQQGEGMVFDSMYEVEHGLNSKQLTLHAKIKFRKTYINESGQNTTEFLDISPGRLFILQLLPTGIKINMDAINKTLKKNDIAELLEIVYRKSGQKQAVMFADQVMRLGFKYACQSGVSIGKDDMVVPMTKKNHIDSSLKKVQEYEEQYAEGLMTSGEKRNKCIDLWTRCSDQITEDMMKILSSQTSRKKEYDFSKLNSISIMADSGARGSSAQIRQLCGIRGLMTKPSGEIIETPIISNFKEGLNELEYFISTHGARKGLADTALKTSNSGYLTRKLVDVAQDSIIIEEDCGTPNYITVSVKIENGKTITSLKELALGRVLAEKVVINKINIIAKRNQLIDEKVIKDLEYHRIESVKVRSVLMCQNKSGVCVRCYGRDLSTGKMVNLGEPIGVIAAQSIGEPGTQLTMRTFHIGGVAQKIATKSDIIASCSGVIRINNINLIQNRKGHIINMHKSCQVSIILDKVEKFKCKIPYGAKVNFSNNSKINIGDKIAEWDPYMIPIFSEVKGFASLVDLERGVTIKETHDEATGVNKIIIIDDSKKNSSLKPRIVIKDKKGNIIKFGNGSEAKYYLSINAIVNVSENQKIEVGDVLAKISKDSTKNRDITGGLPRVVELFEVRVPKDVAILAGIDGFVKFGEDSRNKRRVILSSKDGGIQQEYFVPKGKHISVNEGEYVLKGTMIVEGTPFLQDVLRIMGTEYFAHYITEEVQQVYKLQGVSINNKHIETILRQMLKKVEITDPGQTTFINGEQVDKDMFDKINNKAKSESYEPATAVSVLQGITKASLQTNSFLSAASFQQTVKVLTEAAVQGKKDPLKGLKENVIVGRLIPAGTGFYTNKMRKAINSKK
jgi:DNA-directed RNA polymerase subunit beta'